MDDEEQSRLAAALNRSHSAYVQFRLASARNPLSPFMVRQKLYRTLRQKGPSGVPMYECVAVETIRSDAPLERIYRRLRLPEVKVKSEGHVPALFVVNAMMPMRNPAITFPASSAATETTLSRRRKRASAKCWPLSTIWRNKGFRLSAAPHPAPEAATGSPGVRFATRFYSTQWLRADKV